MPHNAWILAGATATGKSSVCQHLAERMGLNILSADSMLVYQGMDIGTATPSAEERGAVSYFGINVVTPDEPFSAGEWMREVRNSLGPIETSPDKPLIVTGGTGLYIKALTSGIDSEAADPEIRRRWKAVLETEGIEALQNEIKMRFPECPPSLMEEKNPRRLIRALEQIEKSGCLPDNWKNMEQPIVTALTMPREQLYARIQRRVNAMFEQGLLEEVRNLKELYPVWSDTAAKAIGYEESLAILNGTMTQKEAVERISLRTRRLAKRQETWFRHQQNTVWCSIEDGDCVESIAEKVLSLWNKHGPIELKI